MSNFPNQLDSDVTLPPVNDNITEIGADAINSLRDAVLNIEEEIGVGPTSSSRASGTTGSIAARLGVSLDPDGYIKTSALVGIGLVSLPIYDGYIATNAAIQESKLALDHSTQDLFNNILGLSGEVKVAIGWINSTGVKLNPHIVGTGYRHQMDHIDVSSDVNDYFTNRYDLVNPPYPVGVQGSYRNNSNLYALFNDLNNDYLIHQKSDGYVYNDVQNIVTIDGYGTYPSNFAHTAGGIYIDTAGYDVIPTSIDSVQKLADYIDDTSMLLLGGRIQNLYSNGISRASSSSILGKDGYGPPVVPVTKVTTYLLSVNTSTPNDNPNAGDDIILFTPDTSVTTNYEFDSQFSNVKIGDIIRVNYGTVETEFLVKEKKYFSGSPGTFAVRIDGKNLFATTDGYARIDRPLFNPNKYGVLAVSAAQIVDDNGNSETNVIPSLIVSHPRGAVALGNGFDPAQFDLTNYNLYLVLYPDGNPENAIFMPAIDVTGNQGSTPGQYTLESIIEATNNAFRQRGFNSRFVAFSYNGQFGIMLADSYNNAGFSIIAGIIDSSGTKYDSSATQSTYSNNIIRYNTGGAILSDPLGFGFNASSIASPPYTTSYVNAQAAYNFPTKIYLPLKRNNYYVNGSEKENFAPEPYQLIDSYGDGYWIGTVVNKNIYSGSTGRIELTYRVNHNLDTSSLELGQTLVVQSLGQGNVIDYGRYVIYSINITSDVCLPDGYYTDITVFDSVQGNNLTNGISPPVIIPSDSAVDGYQYALYFNSDSVSFNNTNAFDNSISTSYKRHFEIYTDPAGKTFSLERGRMNISGGSITVNGVTLYCTSSSLAKINISRISPKLRGYTSNNVNYIALKLTFDASTEVFTGSLVNSNPSTVSGPIATGKQGEVIRFYDETNIDYIDFIFNLNDNISSFTNQYISIQLFPTLAQDQEVFLLASCQLNGTANTLGYIKDLRQFGNVSEKDLSSSVFDYISAPEKLIHANGVIRGFDLSIANSSDNYCTIKGGEALVNGKLIQLNNTTINIPPVQEYISSADTPINWAICVNSNNEFQLMPLLDSSTLSNTRVFNVRDINNIVVTTYKLDALLFKNIINTRKDLTPLFIINATVTPGSPITYNISSTDVRRYIYNEPLNNTFTWSSDANGYTYFRSSDAVRSWIEYYGSNSNTIKVKGTVLLYSSAADFSGMTKSFIIEGDSDGATINIAGGALSLPANYDVTFKNIKINFILSGVISKATGGTGKCYFENVKITLNDIFSSLNASLGDYAILNNVSFPNMVEFILGSNCEINNCTFSNITSTGANAFTISNNNIFYNCTFGNIISDSTYDAVYIDSNNSFNYCTFGNLTAVNERAFNINGANCIINNCTFGNISSTGTSAGEHTFLIYGSNVKITNSTFGNITSTVTNAGKDTIYVWGHNVLIDNVTINSITSTSTDATTAALYIQGYDTRINNLFINIGIQATYNAIVSYGYNTIISNSNLNNLNTENGIYIIGNNFVFNDNIITYTSSLGSVSGLGIANGGIYADGGISNIKITNCSFTIDAITATGNSPPMITFNLNRGTSVSDVYIQNNTFTLTNSTDQSVAAVAIVENGTGTTDPAVMNNVFIQNNSAKGMSCYLSGNQTTVGTVTTFEGPGLMACNTHVDSNSLYILGIGVSGGTTLPYNYTLKNLLLSVTNNDIDIIDSIANDKTVTISSACESGNVVIKGNQLSFLRQAFYNGTLTIESNIFNGKSAPAFPTSLSNAIEIMDARSLLDSGLLIKNNIIRYKTAKYTDGIVINNQPSTAHNNVISCQITGNSITGFTSTGIYCVNGGYTPTIITNNTISRNFILNNQNIAAYISGYNGAYGASVLNSRYALVVDNVLDSPNPNTTTTNYDVIINRGNNWIVERNINQTVSISLTNSNGSVGMDIGSNDYPTNPVDPIMVGGGSVTATIRSYWDVSPIVLDYTMTILHPASTAATYLWSLELNSILPKNVNLVEISQLVQKVTGSNSTADGYLRITTLGGTPVTTSATLLNTNTMKTMLLTSANLSAINTTIHANSYVNPTIVLLSYIQTQASDSNTATFAWFPILVTYRW